MALAGSRTSCSSEYCFDSSDPTHQDSRCRSRSLRIVTAVSAAETASCIKSKSMAVEADVGDRDE